MPFDASVSFISAVIIGLFATVHCVGMCGGIITALSLSLSQSIQRSSSRRLIVVVLYNLARIISYSVAGFVVGGIGVQAIGMTGIEGGHQLLRYIGVLFMVIIGLYIAGWFPQFSLIEKIGLPVWRLLEPMGRRVLPIDSFAKAFIYGLVWGWLPCGMVYSMLIWSLAAGGSVQGATLMFGFGLGTMPAMITMGLASGWLRTFTQSQSTRRLAGSILIVLALISLFVSFGGHQHH